MTPLPCIPTFTRRDGLRLAAAGGAGLAAAGLSALTPQAHAAPPGTSPSTVSGMKPAADEKLAPGEGLAPGVTAHVAVSATTLWVAPRTHRPDVDAPSLTNPVDLDAWNRNMEDTETRRWLTGELESQAVLGSEVIVDEVDGDWAHVVVTAQGTPRDPRGLRGPRRLRPDRHRHGADQHSRRDSRWDACRHRRLLRHGAAGAGPHRSRGEGRRAGRPSRSPARLRRGGARAGRGPAGPDRGGHHRHR